MSDCDCGSLGRALELVRFLPRQLLTAEDLNDESRYFQAQQRRRNRLLFGFGVVCGLEVTWNSDDRKLAIGPGYALSPSGHEIIVPNEIHFDPAAATNAAATDPCAPPVPESRPGKIGYVVVGYKDCPTRPVKRTGNDCGCDEGACEYSRTREWYELRLLDQIPKSHQPPTQPSPWPACPPCAPDDWVLLAQLDTGLGGRMTVVTPPPPEVRFVQRAK
jgi:hypothetical protein